MEGVENGIEWSGTGKEAHCRLSFAFFTLFWRACQKLDSAELANILLARNVNDNNNVRIFFSIGKVIQS